MDTQNNDLQIGWKDFERIISQSAPIQHQNDTEFTSNILLQVIMPIVLVLALIVFTRIKVLETFMEEVSKRTTQQSYELTLLELQKQVLIRVLDSLQSEEKKALGINDFIARQVVIRSGRPDDPGFKTMCKKTYQCFGKPEYQEKSAGIMFEKVINSARYELKKISQETGLAYQRITQANKQFARDKTDLFYATLIKQVTGLQQQTIKDTFSYFLKKPHEFQDDKLIELIDEYILLPEKEKQAKIIEIYTRLKNKLESDFKDSGFEFLQDTWEKM